MMGPHSEKIDASPGFHRITHQCNSIGILYIWMLEEHNWLISPSLQAQKPKYTAHAPNIDPSTTFL